MRPLALAATLLASTLASGGRVSRGVSDLGHARAWKEERHAKALFEDRYGPVRVVRRLRPTKVVRMPSFIFVSAVLVVRHGNETGMLKIRSVPGDQDTWRGIADDDLRGTFGARRGHGPERARHAPAPTSEPRVRSIR